MSEEKLQTPFGVYSGVISTDTFPDGMVKGIRLNEKNVIMTHAGELIPFYGEDSPRRKYKSSVTFHENGMIRSVSLEEQQEVMTPIGELPAELVTFYDTGELKRVFPLDGKISGFWSEEDERALNIPLRFDFDFTSFTAMISGLCFYKSGDIKSVTLFPGEQIELRHKAVGTMAVRQGFSLYEDGKLQSLEPLSPTKIKTPIGLLTAYDPNANGVNADKNAICLDEQGRISSVICGDKIFVKSSGAMFSFGPKEVCDDDDMSLGVIPLRIEFDYDHRLVTIISDGTSGSYSFDHEYMIFSGTVNNPGCSDGDCAACALCKN